MKTRLQKIHKFGILILGGILFSRAGGLFFRFLCLKFLPISVYGEAVLFIIFLTFFGIVASFGLPVLLSSELKWKRGNKRFLILKDIFSLSLLFSFFIAMLLFIFGMLNFFNFLKMHAETVALLSFALPIYVSFNVFLFYFRATAPKISLLSEIFLSALRIMFLIVLLSLGFVFLSPFLSIILAFFFSTLFMLYHLPHKKIFSFKIKEKKRIILAGGAIFFYECFKNLGINVDRIMLSIFFSPRDTGIYDALVLLCIFYTFVANSYGIAILSQKNVRKNFLSSLKAYLAFSFPYSIFIFFAARPVLEFFKREVLVAYPSFSLLLLSYFIYGIFILSSFSLISLKKYSSALSGAIIFLGTNALLNSWLIPLLHYSGAALSLLIASISSLLYSLLCLYFFK